jgi:hypothetical protein
VKIQDYREIVEKNSIPVEANQIVKDFLLEHGLECKPMRAVLTYEAQRNIAQALMELFINFFPDETWKDNYMTQPHYDVHANCIILVPFGYDIGVKVLDWPKMWVTQVHEQWHANSLNTTSDEQLACTEFRSNVGFNHQSIIDGQHIRSGQAFEEICAVHLEWLFEERLVELGHLVYSYGPTQINDFGYNGTANCIEYNTAIEFQGNYSVMPDWLKEVEEFQDEDLGYNIHTNYCVAKTFAITLFSKVKGLWDLVKRSRLDPSLEVEVISILSNMEHVLATREGVAKTIDFIEETFDPSFYAVSGDILDAIQFVYTPKVDSGDDSGSQELDLRLKLTSSSYKKMSVWDMIPSSWECFHIDFWFAFNVQRMRFLLRND